MYLSSKKFSEEEERMVEQGEKQAKQSSMSYSPLSWEISNEHERTLSHSRTRAAVCQPAYDKKRESLQDSTKEEEEEMQPKRRRKRDKGTPIFHA
jgi:hypothetical protein